MNIYKPAAGLILIIVLFSCDLYSQAGKTGNFQFISPSPGSALHLPETNIILRQGNRIDGSTLDDSRLMVIGSESGIHRGNLILLDDQETLIFQPIKPFAKGEEVNVFLRNGIFTKSGAELIPIEFTFRISELANSDYYRNFTDELIIDHREGKKLEKNIPYQKVLNNRPILADNFPEFTIGVCNDPSPGYIFVSPHDLSGAVSYLMITDNKGVPVYYLKSPILLTDFNKQFNGQLTFYNHGIKKFSAMDSSYKIVGSYQCGNGYQTDGHELLVLPNGHSFLMSYDPQVVRMDTIVPGGDPAAIVYGLIVQELDENKNVIFQWRSWDHFQITDATDDIDLTQHSIDYVHGNSIEFDYDGNLLISCRNMDEITKINRQTGDIIWRLGGLASKNNQFQFINDPITFSHQHDICRLPNGNITLFDNGNLHLPPASRSLEYQLDEVNKIAVLVWNHSNDPVTFEPTRGSTRRLVNHNTIIGWGDHLYPKSISEVKADGGTALEIIFPDSFLNYRTYKYPWRTNRFLADPDSIFFESVSVGDSSTIYVSVINNTAEVVEINGFYKTSDMFAAYGSLPINIQPFGSDEIFVSFKPGEEGYFKDHLYIISDTDTSRVAQVLFMGGRTDTIFSSVQSDYKANEFSLEQNYPNPFNPTTNIEYRISEPGFTSLKVYDVLGNEVAILINEEKPAGTYEVEFIVGQDSSPDIASGIYFYRLKVYPASGGAGSFTETRKMILLR